MKADLGLSPIQKRPLHLGVTKADTRRLAHKILVCDMEKSVNGDKVAKKFCGLGD